MVAPGGRRVVAVRAEEGERVRVQVDPRSVLLSSGRFPTSARNVLRGRVVSRLHLPGWQTQVNVRLGRELLSVLVTPGAERELGLRAGSPVWIYLKATSIRRI